MKIEQNIASARSSLLKGTGVFLLVLVLYFLSSGFAFVSVYRWPSVAPTRFYSVFYWPLDGLARVSRPFREVHTSYQFLCYPTFVQRSLEQSTRAYQDHRQCDA